jgi:hypothetical protein
MNMNREEISTGGYSTASLIECILIVLQFVWHLAVSRWAAKKRNFMQEYIFCMSILNL